MTTELAFAFAPPAPPKPPVVVGVFPATPCADCAAPAALTIEGVAFCWACSGIEPYEADALSAYIQRCPDQAHAQDDRIYLLMEVEVARG